MSRTAARRQRNPLLALLVLVTGWALVAAPTPLAHAGMHWTYDLEYASISGNELTDNGQTYRLEKLNAGGYPTISTEQARNGAHSLKASIPPSGYARSEVINALNVGMRTIDAYSFNVFVPSGHQPPRGAQWQIISQIWQTGCGSPPIAIDLQPNSDPLVYRVLLRNDTTGYRPTQAPKTLVKGNLPRNRWVQFAIEYNIHPTETGQADFKLYVDGQMVPTSFDHGDTIGYSRVDADCPYPVNDVVRIKNGLYRGGAQWEQTQTLYFDDMRFGDRIADVMI
ncbi:heparin lyase I family protein [Microlunatus sp. Y2014]|uniref:heparin lyase I family protein n=1 Tax=Microlunatus sp. Y2014 TaxID=3418488 RepID=UPI003DA7A03F